jgi:hypothetical protein
MSRDAESAVMAMLSNQHQLATARLEFSSKGARASSLKDIAAQSGIHRTSDMYDADYKAQTLQDLELLRDVGFDEKDLSEQFYDMRLRDKKRAERNKKKSSDRAANKRAVERAKSKRFTRGVRTDHREINWHLVGQTRPKQVHPAKLKRELRKEVKKLEQLRRAENRLVTQDIIKKRQKRRAARVAERKAQRKRERDLVSAESGKMSDLEDILLDDESKESSISSAYFHSLFEDWDTSLREHMNMTDVEFSEIFSRIHSMVMSGLGYMQNFIRSRVGDLVNMLLSFLNLGYQVWENRTPFAVASSVFSFVQINMAGAGQKAIEYLHDMIGKLRDVFITLGASLRNTIVAESVSSKLTFIQRLMNQVIKSDLVQAIQSFLLAMLSLKWFPKDVSKTITGFVGKPARMTISELFSLILGGASTIARLGESLASGVPLSEVILSEDPAAVALRTMDNLLLYENHLYSGLPVEGMMCQRQFLRECHELLITVDKLLPTLSGYDHRRSDMRRKKLELERMYLDVQAETCSANRVPPIGIVLAGPPGIGKSKLIDCIAAVHSSVKGRVYDPDHIFAKNPDDEFWEGYVPQSHPYVHIPEVGNISKNLAQSHGLPILPVLNCLMDGRKYTANMAFEKKGKVFPSPELILIDTNNPNMHIHDVMNAPGAMFRRFVFIHARVKKEFLKAGTTMLDVSKSLAAESHIMDRYYFTIERYGSKGNHEVLISNKHDLDIFELVEYLRENFSETVSRADQVHATNHYDFIINDDLKSEIDEKENYSGPVQVEGGKMWIRHEWSPKWDELTAKGRSIIEEWKLRLIICLCACVSMYLSARARKRDPLLWGARLYVFMSFCLWFFLPFSLSLALVFFFLPVFVVETFYNNSVLKFYNPVVRVLEKRQAVMERRLDYLLQPHKPHNPFQDAQWSFMEKGIVTIVSALSLALGTTLVIRKCRKFNVRSEGASMFRDICPENEDLEQIEQQTGTSLHRRRVKTKQHAAWNYLMGNLTVPAHKGSMIELFLSLGPSIRPISINEENRTHMFGLCNSFAIVNKHTLMDLPCTIEVYNDAHDLLCTPRKFTITESDVCIINADLVLVNFRNALRFKNNLVHFVDGTYPPYLSGCYMGKNVDVVHIQNVEHIDEYKGETFFVPDAYRFPMENHKRGHCGRPLIVQVAKHGTAIIGFHTGGHMSDVVCQAVTRSELERAISILESQCSMFIVNSEGGLAEDLEVPITKSPFTHEYYPHLDYYGKIVGKVLVNKQSKMEYSEFEPLLPDFFKKHFDFVPTVRFSKPMMRPTNTADAYISPYNIGLNKMNKTPPSLNYEVLEHCVRLLTIHILDELREKGITEVFPLSIEEAVNGIEGDDFIQRVNPMTSGGHGFRGEKHSYIPIVYEDAGCVIREPVPLVKRKILNAFKRYEAFESANFVFVSQLKDEPRELEKCANGSTRLFYMGCLDNLILARMFLSPFYSLMIEHSEIFCSAVGINMHTESNGLVERLTSLSSNIMEGDYSGFDVSNPIGISSAACTVVYDVLQALGYNDKAMIYVRGLLSDSLYPLINMNMDLFTKAGMQPSGKYGTAEDNCLRNALMAMYIWYMQEELADKYFFDHVVLYTYGDDFLASVSDECAPYYNNIIYAEKCEEYYAMKFTASDKGDVSAKFLKPKDMTFLKRSFRFNESREVWEGQLDLNSVYKSLEWVIPSRNMAPRLQMTQTVMSMLWELYFHARDVTHFDEIRSDFIDMLVVSYLGDPAFYDEKLPTFSAISSAVYPSDAVNAFVTDYDTTCEMKVHCEGGRFDDGARRSESVWWEFAALDKFNGNPHPSPSSSLCHGLTSTYRHANSFEEYKMDPARTREGFLRRLYAVEEKLTELDVDYSSEDVLITMKYGPKHYMSESSERVRVVMRLLEERDSVLATLRVLDRIGVKRHRVRYATESGLMAELHQGAIETRTMKDEENLMDVGGNASDLHFAGESKYPEFGQSEVMGIEAFFSRPVEILTTTLSVSGSISTNVALWDLWSLQPSIRAKLRNFAYLSGTMVARVQVYGTPFHSGRIMVSPQYYPARNANIAAHDTQVATYAASRPLYLNYLSQAYGAASIDVKNNTPLEIRLPFVHHKPMFRLYNTDTAALGAATSFADMEEALSLYLYTLNDLTTASPTNTDISIQVFAWVEDIKLGTNTASMMAVSTESGKMSDIKEGDERETGPVERLATAAATVSDLLSSYPPIAPFATASSFVFTGLSKFASMFGWSKPVLITDPSYVKNRPFANGTQFLGASTAKRITYDPKQELTIDPRVCGIDDDELVITRLAGRESYLTTFDWTTSDSVMASPIWECRVHPQLDTYFTDTLKYFHQPTSMSFAVQPFLYWHGTIEYRFEIVASAYHRGKLGIFYEPNISQYGIISADLALNKNYFAIVDIQETQSFSVCVEWAQPRAWCKTFNVGQSIFNHGPQFSATQDATEYVNGVIGVVVFGENTSPNNSDIRVNVYVRCPDLRVNVLTDDQLPSERFITESGKMSDLHDTPVSCIPLNASSFDDTYLSMFHFGEEPLTLRGALKRFSAGPAISGSVGTGTVLSAVVDTIPIARPAYGSSTTQPTLMEYLMYAFLGVRGGVRKRLHAITADDKMGSMSRSQVILGVPAGYVAPTATFVPGPPLSRGRGTVSFVPDTNGGIEIEAPYYSLNLYSYAFADDHVGTNSDNDMVDEWIRTIQFEAEMTDNTSGSSVVVETASGEDFTFMRFSGAPMYSLDTIV